MRFQKSVSVLLLAAMLLCALAGCGKNNVKAFYFTVNASAGTFDPQIADDTTARMIVRNCYEGLVRLNETGKPLPAVCSSFSVSNDGLTYTFTLKSGTKWYVNSTVREQFKDKLPEDYAPEVTAYDFAFALFRVLTKDNLSPDASLLFRIKNAEDFYNGKAKKSEVGIKTPNEHTLVLTLNAPDEGFFEILTEPICMPCNEEFFELCAGRYGLFVRTSLFNGPFTLTRFDDTSYRLAKNTAYTGEYAAKADVIWFYSGKTREELKNGMESGDYDGGFLGLESANGISDKNTKTVSVPDATRGFLFNLNGTVTQNPNIRKAFKLATDLSALSQKLNEPAADHILPGVCALTDRQSAHYYQPNKARAVFEQGLKEEKLDSATLTVLCETRHESVLREYMQLWQKYLGALCNIKISAVSYRQLCSEVCAGNYDIAFYPLCTSFFSPIEFYRCFSSDEKQNLSGLTDESVDQMLLELTRLNGNQLNEKALLLENRLLELCVFLPVYSEGSSLVTTKQVNGILLLPGADRVYFNNCDEIKQ